MNDETKRRLVASIIAWHLTEARRQFRELDMEEFLQTEYALNKAIPCLETMSGGDPYGLETK